MAERARKPRAKRGQWAGTVRAMGPATPEGARDAEQEARAVAQLDRIRHVVVLMLENRSFDHMLGYLKLEGGRADVDGLTAEMSNTHAGAVHTPFHLQDTLFLEDPHHHAEDVAQQLEGDNGGFARNFASVHPAEPGKIMGYYNATGVPVYDHLAREYCVCDRWFSSFAGPTWVNRLYSLAGHSNGETVNRKLPVYNIPAFTRHLDERGVSWRWYSQDVPTLRLADGKYRLGYGDRFVNVSKLAADARAGALPAVTWIDPNFANFQIFDRPNDDHPPADIVDGQRLVLETYNALVSGPGWNSTLFVITYDEHGGFYDHVVPPPAADEWPDFQRYGVRVPALVVSPWVKPGSVSSMLFDHTSLIKTVLVRFCRDADVSVPYMSERVSHANHLGWLLTEERARTRGTRAAARSAARTVGAPLQARARALPRAMPPTPPTDLQQEMEAARRYMQMRGLPPGPS